MAVITPLDDLPILAPSSHSSTLNYLIHLSTQLLFLLSAASTGGGDGVAENEFYDALDLMGGAAADDEEDEDEDVDEFFIGDECMRKPVVTNREVFLERWKRLRVNNGGSGRASSVMRERRRPVDAVAMVGEGVLDGEAKVWVMSVGEKEVEESLDMMKWRMGRDGQWRLVGSKEVMRLVGHD